MVDCEFWNEDEETAQKLQDENNQSIQNEQRFREELNKKIREHTEYIVAVQKTAHQNAETFCKEDTEQRQKLRAERLEWNEKLKAMECTNQEMKGNLDTFKQNLTKFGVEIDKMVQDIKDADVEEAQRGKKAKSKTKISKVTTDIVLPQNIVELVNDCKDVSENVPKWMYGDKIKACNEAIYSTLYEIQCQCNAQFSALIEHKQTVHNLNEECFKVCSYTFVFVIAFRIFVEYRNIAINMCFYAQTYLSKLSWYWHSSNRKKLIYICCNEQL